ncbi:MAG TPA: condensation domain-containing protein, partial [Flavitalea sp.]|nr:condensation domain-containing protein [Flavitalea sp.]
MSQSFEKVIDLLYLAKQNGVDVALNEDQLQLKLPKNRSIDKGLVEQLKNNKQLVIDFLKEHAKSANKANAIKKVERDPGQQLPLSFSQERLWFIHQMEGSVQYHIPAVLRLLGALNKRALEQALHHIVHRHEVLRTVFLEKDGHARQVIRDSKEWHLNVIDGSQYSNDDTGFQKFVQQLIGEPFNLEQDYMVRAHLVQVNEEEHILVVVTHHIASDGWSTSIIVKEVIELYSAYSEGLDPILPDLPIQYADYAVWQRNFLQGEILNKKVDYWKQKLLGVTALQLPSDYKRPSVWSANGSSRGFSIEKHLSDQLVALSQGQGSTLYMTLLAAFNILLYKYSGQQDICIGSPIANRTQQEVENLIGFFINTLPLRTEVNGEASFTELLQQVRATTMEGYEHQDVPFEKIVEVVVKERDLSRNPLFQVMFALQNTPYTPQLRLRRIELSPIRLPQTTTKFDITFLLVETPQGIRGDMQFATDLYDERTIIRIMDHYKQLLLSIVASPDKKIDDLLMLADHEKQTLLVDFNNTRVDYPEHTSIISLFEEQAVHVPEAIAIISDSARLTYKELNERANQVAQYLIETGATKETLVAVCIERSVEMV